LKFAYAFCSCTEDLFQYTQTKLNTAWFGNWEDSKHLCFALSETKIKKIIGTLCYNLAIKLESFMQSAFLPKMPYGLHKSEASITSSTLILQSFEHECYGPKESRTFLQDVFCSSGIQAVDFSNRLILLSVLTAESLKRNSLGGKIFNGYLSSLKKTGKTKQQLRLKKGSIQYFISALASGTLILA